MWGIGKWALIEPDVRCGDRLLDVEELLRVVGSEVENICLWESSHPFERSKELRNSLRQSVHYPEHLCLILVLGKCSNTGRTDYCDFDRELGEDRVKTVAQSLYFARYWGRYVKNNVRRLFKQGSSPLGAT